MKIVYDIPLLLEKKHQEQMNAQGSDSDAKDAEPVQATSSQDRQDSKKAEYDVDFVLVVSASAEAQRHRVLARPGMTEDRFESIFSKQIPDADKRAVADFVVRTDFEGFAEASAQVRAVH